MIDFSSPNALDGILTFIEANEIPAVICTTGYTAEQTERIKQASKKVPILLSANTSVGIQCMLRAVKLAARNLSDFDAAITEIHHTEKKDVPSGTAISLFNAITDEKKSFSPCDSEKNPCIHSIRCGNVVGEHSVIFAGENEELIITHKATDKAIFAIGALKAAKFLLHKKAGFYDMSDLFGE